MTTAQLTHQEALSRAKINLMAKPDSAFFITLCFSMRHVWDTSIPTAAASAKTMTVYWNPAFFMRLTEAGRIFLMLHETFHIAYLHMDRCQDRDHALFNIACDHVINLMLIERGFQMPTGIDEGYADPRFKDMSAEQVYDILKAEGFQPPKNFITDIQLDPADPTLKDKIERLLQRAAIQSKLSGDKPGTIPADLELLLDKLLNPKLPWYRILGKYFQEKTKGDYTMKKPNRRFMPRFYLPTLYSDALMDLPFIVDMSISVSDDDVGVIVSEVGGVIKNLRPKKLTLVQFDVAIRSVHEVPSIEALKKVPMRGRGGTNIQPVIEWINQNRPKCSVILTDGEFDWPDITTKHDVVWLIHNNPDFTAPFGKVIHYEMTHGH